MNTVYYNTIHIFRYIFAGRWFVPLHHKARPRSTRVYKYIYIYLLFELTHARRVININVSVNVYYNIRCLNTSFRVFARLIIIIWNPHPPALRPPPTPPLATLSYTHTRIHICHVHIIFVCIYIVYGLYFRDPGANYTHKYAAMTNTIAVSRKVWLYIRTYNLKYEFTHVYILRFP